jgi:hypothetical protein
MQPFVGPFRLAVHEAAHHTENLSCTRFFWRATNFAPIGFAALHAGDRALTGWLIALVIPTHFSNL